MTRNERKRAANAKRNAIIAASDAAIAVEQAKVEARNAREQFLATYTIETRWSPRGSDTVSRTRIGGVMTQGGVRKFVAKQPKPTEPLKKGTKADSVLKVKANDWTQAQLDAIAAMRKK